MVSLGESALQSRLQVAASIPIFRVSGIPQSVRAEEGQLAAVLRHAADLVHLQAVTQLASWARTALFLAFTTPLVPISRGMLEHLKPLPLISIHVLCIVIMLKIHCAELITPMHQPAKTIQVF